MKLKDDKVDIVSKFIYFSEREDKKNILDSIKYNLVFQYLFFDLYLYLYSYYITTKTIEIILYIYVPS